VSVVLDASALLAYLQVEPGSDRVRSILDGAVMSTVNWAEVIQKVAAAGVETAGLRRDIEILGLGIVAFTAYQAEVAGTLSSQTRKLGLCLADRACLALGLDRGEPVYTTDRAWKRLDIGIAIHTLH
jgi:PIN domain nuclease of toxin-antitoxin system